VNLPPTLVDDLANGSLEFQVMSRFLGVSGLYSVREWSGEDANVQAVECDPDPCGLISTTRAAKFVFEGFCISKFDTPQRQYIESCLASQKENTLTVRFKDLDLSAGVTSEANYDSDSLYCTGDVTVQLEFPEEYGGSVSDTVRLFLTKRTVARESLAAQQATTDNTHATWSLYRWWRGSNEA
jgi:hypothetical protein